MKRTIVLVLTVVLFSALSVVNVEDASAGIFGRGRGLFRGGWGSRRVGGCGAACSPGYSCGPAGCSPTVSKPNIPEYPRATYEPASPK